MTKKVVFIFFQPPTISHEKNYFFKELIQAGIDIEVWDITSIIFGQLTLPDEMQANYVKKIGSKKKFRTLINCEDISNSIFILAVSFDYRSYWLYRLLTKLDCTICRFVRGELPNLIGNRSIRSLKKRLRPKKIFSVLLNRSAKALQRTRLIKEFDIVFLTGEVQEGTYSKHSLTIPINSIDYDRYLNIENSRKAEIAGEYCVFLDEFLPFHPDWEILGIDRVDSEIYFHNLNRFFEELEKRFGLSIIIAAHPKSEYSVNPFNGREIHKYKTVELVRDSQLVVAHASTSIGYSVLFGKPLMLVYDSQIEQVHAQNVFSYIKGFWKELGCGMVKIDDESMVKTLHMPEINEEKYEAFKYRYLASKNTDKQFSKDIVVDFFANYVLKQTL